MLVSRTVSRCFVELSRTASAPPPVEFDWPDDVVPTRICVADAPTLMLVGVPVTATVVALVTVLVTASISVTRFRSASNTRIVFALSFSASAVGRPPTAIRVLMKFVPGSRASTAAPLGSSTYSVLFRGLRTICWTPATSVRSVVPGVL